MATAIRNMRTLEVFRRFDGGVLPNAGSRGLGDRSDSRHVYSLASSWLSPIAFGCATGVRLELSATMDQACIG